MLYTLSSSDFSAAVRQKQKQKDENAVQCWEILGALTSCWLKKLGGQKLSVMMFLVNRTLYYRKEAQQVWFFQFLKGVVDKDGNRFCDEVGMSENSLRKHLAELIEHDYVHAYRCIDEVSGAENQARLYEINFKKLLEPYHVRGSKMPFLNKSKAEKALESSLERGSNDRGAPLPTAGSHNSSYKRLTKVNLSGRAPRSGCVDSGLEINPPKLKVPKRGYAEPTPVYMDPVTPTAREVAEAVMQRSRDGRAERVAKAVTIQPWLLTKLDMQAMFDAGMDKYYPKETRLVLTGTLYGMLKKQLKKYQPKDYSAFLDWTLRYWTDTASKNRAAIMRNEERTAKDRPMSGFPEAGAFVYRMPYFLKVYSSFLADRTAVEKDDDDNREIKRLQHRLSQAEREAKVLRQRTSSRPVEAEPDEYEPTRKRYTRTLKVIENSTIDIGDDEIGRDGNPLLTWEEREERAAAEKRRVS